MDALEHILEPTTTQSRERRVHGLVTAIVRGIEDDGTYKLEYLSMGSGEPSAPARVMMPMAGGGRGTYFFPEVGDEVVVAFELGDTSLPIILGGVWNNDAPPPDQAEQSTDNNIRTIVSRSGHQVTFDDTAGREKVVVKTQGGHELTLDDKPAQAKITLKTADGRKLMLDDTPPGSASLETPSGSKLSISDAGGAMTIEAPLSIRLQSNTITLQANAMVLNTTGAVTTSALMIDGIPFGLHRHIPPAQPGPPPTTGPVSPT